MHRLFQTTSVLPRVRTAPTSRTAVVPRLLALATFGALSLSACATGAGAADSQATGGSAAASSTTRSTTASSTSAPASPSQTSSTEASSAAGTGTQQAAAGEEPIVSGAASEAWMKQARSAVVDTDPKSTACLDTLLDQTMLDAVATYLPKVDSVVLGGLRHEAGCTFTAAGDPGTAPTVQVNRFYIANDTSKTMDETGLLGSDMCATGRKKDADGISTDVEDVVMSRGPGGDVKATMRGAWSCSEDGKIGTAFLVSAGAAEKKGIPDPNQLAQPEFAVAAATHLHDTEVDWAPTLDDLYEANFRDILGQ